MIEFDEDQIVVKKDLVEIEDLNGNRFLIDNHWSKIYDLVEKTRFVVRWCSRFPFVHFEKQRYCSFKFRTIYTTLNSFFDKRYKINCNLSQLAALFGIEFKEFDRTIVMHDVKCQNML